MIASTHSKKVSRPLPGKAGEKVGFMQKQFICMYLVSVEDFNHVHVASHYVIATSSRQARKRIASLYTDDCIFRVTSMSVGIQGFLCHEIRFLLKNNATYTKQQKEMLQALIEYLMFNAE